MKSYKRIYVCVIIAVMVIVFITNISAYQYPSIKRGTEEWNNLSREEKRAMLQIPENVLADLPTEELIQAYLDYPHVAIMAAYNNLQDGFERVYRDFNGLRELLTREDAGKELIKKYQSMDPNNYNNSTKASVGSFIIDFIHIETLIAQEKILNQLTQSETNTLVAELLEKYQKKTEHFDIYGLYGLEINALPLGRLIRLKSGSNEKFKEIIKMPGMEQFLNTSLLGNVEILNTIIKNSKELTKD